mmetsp:Transcript_17725/g.33626  ORF Transcript_17725/g.33626 Transcript_17725/m.33626 type:complete len:83 (-) Transcript_17725:280-528(-)
MEDEMPDRAIWRYDEYGPVVCTMIWPFIKSFCDYKGIVCDEARLAQEADIIASMSVTDRRRLAPRRSEDSHNWAALDELDET